VVDGVRAAYGKKEVLHDLSFMVERGSIVAVVGPNGAGKTTMANTVLGFLSARAGMITLNGREVTRLSTSERIRLGMGIVPEGARAFPNRSAKPPVGRLSSRQASAIRRAMEAVWELFPILKERPKQSAQTLSGGERQMLAIGRAMMLRPSLLVLDEPSLGLSPIALAAVFDALARLRAEDGLSVLLIEQNVRAAFRISDRAYVMSMGSVVSTIDAPVLRQQSMR
jgi:branched-chain amino acid transport system ATP-binding protein